MGKEIFKPEPILNSFATVVLPIALPKLYTYSISPEMYFQLRIGMRVEVQFGRNKLYSGLVVDIHQNEPSDYKVKDIVSIIDSEPVISSTQYELWQWIAKYYSCTVGEVMNAALPSTLKLTSETIVLLRKDAEVSIEELSDKEYMVTEALTIQNELKVDDIRKIIGQKTVYGLINKLISKGIIILKEELKRPPKRRVEYFVRLVETLENDEKLLSETFGKLERATRQMEILMAYLQLSKTKEHLSLKEVLKKSNSTTSVMNAMVKKSIFELYHREDSDDWGIKDGEVILNDSQIEARDEIEGFLKEKDVVLLHGITGSGKTHIYIDMINKVVKEGGQVLFMVPEIALTTQLINRLKKVFGDKISAFHSRATAKEREKMWYSAKKGIPVLFGARSSVFLPFSNLKLIIIDEEHDTSYKQYEPSPRYNARDVAIYLAAKVGAKVILGTATPSIESYFNAKLEKYGLVELNERFNNASLPEVLVYDLRQDFKVRGAQAYFGKLLIDELTQALDEGRQAILFQNRRGYAPSVKCNICGWIKQCKHCDVSMTFHQYTSDLRCHYCGFRDKVPNQCPACGNHILDHIGIGTERITEDLKIYLPEARIARMDMDTVRKKNAHEKLISDFENHNIDILVGTQMVTKGLDFENVKIVGIINASNLLAYPDFRATERAFQLITQVSGRAGRNDNQGKVIIQTTEPKHFVFSMVVNNDYASFYRYHIAERQQFFYPPFFRLINVRLKHKKNNVVQKAAALYGNALKKLYGERILGPAVSLIPRVRAQYQMDILIKMERKKDLIDHVKKSLNEITPWLKKQEGMSTVRVIIDVDPY